MGTVTRTGIPDAAYCMSVSPTSHVPQYQRSGCGKAKNIDKFLAESDRKGMPDHQKRHSARPRWTWDAQSHGRREGRPRGRGVANHQRAAQSTYLCWTLGVRYFPYLMAKGVVLSDALAMLAIRL